MKNKKYWLIVLLINILIVALVIGSNLFSLTYTEIPIQEQHMFYADTFQHYLFFDHLTTTIVGSIILIVVDIVAWINK